MAAVASVMSLLEEAAGRGSFRTEVAYIGRQLTAQEKRRCSLYRNLKYLQCSYIIATAEARPGSYNMDALVAHLNRKKASCAMSLICNGLDSESDREPDSSDSDDI